MHSLLANSISLWGGFVMAFFKKYFSNDKTVKLRNGINHCVQLEKEFFWKCFERLKLLLPLCPQHGLERWCLCEIIYKGLDQANRTMAESICQGSFLNKCETKAWDFLEELAEKTLQWETTRDESLGARINSQKGRVHTRANTTCIDTRFAALKNMLRWFCDISSTNQLSPYPDGFMFLTLVH